MVLRNKLYAPFLNKMLPRIDVVYSLDYNRLFNKNFNKKSLKKLKDDCKEFERLYKGNINKILRLIPKYSGYSWKDKRIPIFVSEISPSFACSPMISLCYKRDNRIMIMRLVHELVHVNLSFFFPEKNDAFNEGAATLISRYVIEKIFDWRDLFLERKYGKFLKKMKYDLNKHPLKHYLKKRYLTMSSCF